MECFAELSKDSSLNVRLLRGSGAPQGENEIVVPCFRRDSRLGALLTRAPRLKGVPRLHGYLLEQITFAVVLRPIIEKIRPDVLYFSDRAMGRLASRLYRRRYGVSLLFSNGGGFLPPFDGFDCVQHVTPDRYRVALERGGSPGQHALIPYGFAIPPQRAPVSDHERRDLRASLNLPTDRPVLLTVGVLSKIRKRMDYLVREIADLKDKRPYLVMLGQEHKDTPAIRAMADELLGKENYRATAVPYRQMSEYYRAADAFVLASLDESFGRVYVEALSYGLPCFAHRYSVTEYVAGDNGFLDDLRDRRTLSALLRRHWDELGDADAATRRLDFVYRNFSWDVLRSQYVSLVLTTGGKPSHAVAVA